MDLSFLDKSSNVTPLLVKLYDSQQLHNLALDEKPIARAELTSAVSELLDMDLSPRESELIADVLIGIMRQAELDLREALAEKLSLMDSVPLRLVLQLTNDEIEVAGPMLSRSPVLGDLDLIYTIKSKGPAYWQAVAKREAMSNQVINLLADTRDFETAITLTKNEGIKLTEHAVVVLSDMAQKSDELAMPLLRRDEVTKDIAEKLYNFVGEQVKSFITDSYGVKSASIADKVDEVIVELVAANEAVNEFAPTDAMIRAADRYKSKGLLTTKLMLGALRRGQIQSFIAQFAKFTGLGPETTLEIMSQSSGQGLAVACKAFDIAKEDFVSIFLLTNRIRNSGRMVDLTDMSKAINYFTKIKGDVARGIIDNSIEKIVSE